MQLRPAVALALFLVVTGCGMFLPPKGCRGEVPLAAVRLPPGFEIAIYATGVPGARSLALGDRGTVFVGTRDEGSVYALLPAPDGRRAAGVRTVASGLRLPNGVAFRDGSLFVAEVSRVIRFDRIESRLDDPPAAAVVNASFPDESHHGWKFIAFGPDGWLYVPVGAPCNVCLEKDPRFATIMRMRPDGTDLEVYASGVRNSVGFDWAPGDGALWFTDNGRDWLGDDLPDDELNRAPAAGLHFGFPFCHAGDLPDPEFGPLRPCREFQPPAVRLGAHVAALGMRFYGGAMFPTAYRGSIFIAEHGSWNRSAPTGYRIVRVPIEEGRATPAEVFAEGWLRAGTAWGRPVDLLVMPDGALLVSDDRAGVIYRISVTNR
ncbi:MAG TPA: PQQ-dependent sugar dehydrogenase [Candidatus Methanoperedens sp.]|nr:PQQ-dependent sugar dehydrogenase [Candidatus Methanoperedens sp.]